MNFTCFLFRLAFVLDDYAQKPAKPVGPDQTNPPNELKRMHSQSLADYLLSMTSSNHCDILFLFHSFDLKYYVDLIDYYDSKLNKRRTRDTRFAIGYYDNDKYDRHYFEMSKFGDNDSKTLKRKLVDDIMDIKSDIMNLDWKHKSHKLVINFIAEKNFIRKLISSSRNIEEFLSNEDVVGKQLKYDNVYFVKFEVNQSRIDKLLIDDITSEKFLNNYTDRIKRVSFWKDLYYLKRNVFNSVEEYKQSQKEKVFDTEYKSLPNNTHVTYETFTKKESEFESVKRKSTQDLDIKLNEGVLEPTRNLFLRCAKFYSTKASGYVWLEILENEDSLKRILDIHLTAQCLAERFNNKNSCITIEIAKISRVVYDSKWITSVYADHELNESEITEPCSHSIDAMECFTHFTYEHTKRTLLVIDLRTIHVSNKKIFKITEPVVFSLIPNRFSSSDLGQKGIEHFRAHHKCNSFCKEIGLSSLV